MLQFVFIISVWKTYYLSVRSTDDTLISYCTRPTTKYFKNVLAAIFHLLRGPSRNPGRANAQIKFECPPFWAEGVDPPRRQMRSRGWHPPYTTINSNFRGAVLANREILDPILLPLLTVWDMSCLHRRKCTCRPIVAHSAKRDLVWGKIKTLCDYTRAKCALYSKNLVQKQTILFISRRRNFNFIIQNSILEWATQTNERINLAWHLPFVKFSLKTWNFAKSIFITQMTVEDKKQRKGKGFQRF